MPQKVVKYLSKDELQDVIEIVLDIGRAAEIRHAGGKIDKLGNNLITEEDIDFVTSHLQEFTHDNRSGIPGTLHRISAIRNRQGKVVGLTCRIGRVVTGTIACIKDICTQGKSILFLGRPGVGKTTKLREISRLVADELGKRVVIVDTSNEIAGDGDTPHPAIGAARRMQVPQPEFQKDIMIEAVENHTPEVIVVDEIGTEAEAQAAKVVTSGPIRHANGNIYHVKDGVITKVELFQRNKAGELVKNSVELTDPTKISKHLGKQNIDLADLAISGTAIPV